MTGTDREKDFDMLYHFEFETIPKLFRKFGRKYINILEQPAELYRQFKLYCEAAKYANPYSWDSFSHEILQNDDDLVICKLNFPKPFREPLCECAYAFLYEKKKFFRKKFEMRYFTKEIGRREDEYFLGERDDIRQGTIGPVWFLQERYAFKDELDFFRKIVMEDMP